MAEAYRAVIGQTESQCSDAEAIDRLLNPARNLYRLETLNVGVHAPTMRALQHANYTFAKKISHTPHSQDHPHPMLPGSRPLLTLPSPPQPQVHRSLALLRPKSLHRISQYPAPPRTPRRGAACCAPSWQHFCWQKRLIMCPR